MIRPITTHSVTTNFYLCNDYTSNSSIYFCCKTGNVSFVLYSVLKDINNNINYYKLESGNSRSTLFTI